MNIGGPTLIALAAGGPTLGLVIVLYFVFHPEKVSAWGDLISRFLLALARATRCFVSAAQRRRIAANLEAEINISSRDLVYQSQGALLDLIRIEWVSGTRAIAVAESGGVVVRMRDFGDQERNLVVATLAFLTRGLLPRIRSYIDPVLTCALDFVTARRILASSSNPGAVARFHDSHLIPAISKDAALESQYRRLENLDQEGTFTRVLLPELEFAGRALAAAAPSRRIESEVSGFVDFLHAIATKKKGEDVRLLYSGTNISVGVMLVARQDTWERYGASPYLSRFRWYTRQGVKGVYLMAAGEECTRIARKILNRVRRARLLHIRAIDEFDYGTGITRLLVASCSPVIEYIKRRAQEAKPVVEILQSMVDEIRNHDWRVVGVERVKGVGAKVALIVPGTVDPETTLRTYLKTHAEVRAKLRLGNERIYLVPWHSTPEDFLRSSLVGVNPQDIISITVKEEDFVAEVHVRSHAVRREAVGKNGWNIKTSSRLAGMLVNLDVADSVPLESVRSDERFALEAVADAIPEIQSGKVSVKAIARQKGAGIKVFVAWNEGGNLTPAAEVCSNYPSRLKELKSKTGMRSIHFCEWSTDPRSMVIRALFPLSESDVASVHIDPASHTATVYVTTDQAIRRASGSHDRNRQLAERLTGWMIRIRPEGDRV